MGLECKIENSRGEKIEATVLRNIRPGLVELVDAKGMKYEKNSNLLVFE